MNIGKRLGLGFALILSLLIVTTTIGIWRLQTVAHATSAMMEQPLAKERLVSDWYRTIHTSVRRTLAVAKSSDPSLANFFAEENTSSSKVSSELQKKISELLESDQEKVIFDKIGVNRKVYVEMRDAISTAKQAGDTALAAQVLETKFMPSAKLYLSLLDELLVLQRSSINATAAGINTTFEQSRTLMLLLGVLAVSSGVLCAWYLTIGITRPLNSAVGIARSVAEGDLTTVIPAHGKDEIGQLMAALKIMNDNLLRIVGQVRSGTDMIATASREIATGNMDLSSRTEAQASSLEQTAAAMEELTSTVRQNAENAQQASTLAVSASRVAKDGGEVVGQVVSTMSAINDSSRKIVDIISVIDGIAFQTNILALNAAVEAARAGEQGRGFAVVASEVRSLAQRSAAAAREIKILIGDSVDKVATGSKLVEQAGVTIGEVVDSVKRVTDIVAEISAAGQEQSGGIGEVNRAITHMDEATQQNAALVEQAAAAAQSLQDQAATLAQLVSIFKLDGQRAVPPPAARRVSPVSGKVVAPVKAAVNRPAPRKEAVKPHPSASAKALAGAGEEAWEEF
ncbi:methyl-accepting chemotaxis protein [Herbaspirillum sp. RTI4]|nr:methyl-accepting chemotaxis protein [Herbaspirillum sp. RTI4]MDY7579727.1 methyl-accepting chemotaxis protein [Herbaspirillum sp. RTI4]MEA9983054.1 methyl-accepting chemotaxis protein [Herbaspirillum sp. RTI4]